MDSNSLKTVKSWRCEGGRQFLYSHRSDCLNCSMEFSAFVPDALPGKKLPVLYYLSGLTCTWENAASKAGIQRHASQHGLIVVFPDTSPRGEDVPDVPDNYSLGQGAGFYLNATESPWSNHYHMYSYVTEELIEAVRQVLPQSDHSRAGITGHSMGGHGALTLALKNPSIYKSVSAFSPIVCPTEVPWGQNAFRLYLGENQDGWKDYDACQLIASKGWNGRILVDQGTADAFLGSELLPEKLMQACTDAGVELTLRYQGGFDHSYYFVSAFIGDHIQWHAEQLV